MHDWFNKRERQLFPVQHNSTCFDLPKRIAAVLGNGVKDDVSELLMQIRGNKLLTKMLCVRRVHLLFPQRGVAFAAAAALSLAG